MSILWLGSPACHSLRRAGGKAAQLSRLAAHWPVPPGFCIEALTCRSARPILPPAQAAEIAAAYEQLGQQLGCANPAVAVRSSAIGEDGHEASFAGQHATYLNVSGAGAVLEAVENCLASVFSAHASQYRRAHHLHRPPRMAVLVQTLVRSDVSAVVFSADPRRGQPPQILINAAWGLGESLVSGSVTPDLYALSRSDLRLRQREISDKTVMTIAAPGGIQTVAVPRALRHEPCLAEAQITELGRLALALEKRQGWPVDLECAFANGRLYLLQCRPITTLARPAPVAQPAASEALPIYAALAPATGD